MYKFLAVMLFATVPLIASPAPPPVYENHNHHHHHNKPEHGFFWTTADQTIAGVSDGVYSGVSWVLDNSENTKGIYIDVLALDCIIIRYPGTYIATYNVTASNNEEAGSNYRFALLLNGTLVPGSIYGASTDSEDDSIEQLTGQVVFHVCSHHSILKLVNDSESGDAVALENIAGTSGATNNNTASIFIQKLSKKS